MKTLNALLAVVILAGVAGAPLAAAQPFDPGVPPPKVPADYYVGAEKAVYHLSVNPKEKGYLAVQGNVRNHLNALVASGVKPEIKVVINGDGLGLLQLAHEQEFDANARLPAAITELREKGVQFLVCYNTLTGRKIPMAKLYGAKPGDLVPAGVAEVAEVARLQALGYHLVKP